MLGWVFDNDAAYAAHCQQIDLALPRMQAGEFQHALAHLDCALTAGESPNARWNRALTLLALGRYREGFEDYEARWWLSPHLMDPRAQQLRRDLPLWKGEDLHGKRLVVIHEAGFGDTIMLLRYIPALHDSGVDVALAMPPELERIALLLAPALGEVSERDVQCCTYDLMRLLEQTPATIPTAPYLRTDRVLGTKWRCALQHQTKRKIGVAWSTIHAYPTGRSIPLHQLVGLLELYIGLDDCQLYSLQLQEHALARAHAVRAYEFEDFADVAALLMQMDSVISIDTAALHLAGALGHPDVTCLLPHVPCWRWQSANWYPQIRFCRQTSPGDWASCFEQL